MDSNQWFRWNKQKLAMSSCFVSLCLLPTAVEGGMLLGDLRIQNVPQDPSYNTLNQSYMAPNREYLPSNAVFTSYPENNPSYPQADYPQEDSSFSQEFNPYVAADTTPYDAYSTSDTDQQASFANENPQSSYSNENPQGSYSNVSPQPSYSAAYESYNTFRGYRENRAPEARPQMGRGQWDNRPPASNTYMDRRSRENRYPTDNPSNPAMQQPSEIWHGRETRENRSGIFSDNENRMQFDRQPGTFQSAPANTNWPTDEQMTVDQFETHFQAFQLRSSSEGESNPNALTSTAGNWNASGTFVAENRWNPSSDNTWNPRASDNAWNPSSDNAWNVSTANTWDTPEDAPWSCVDACDPCCMSNQCCWGNFRIFGDFLYWDLCQNNLDFAVCAKDITGVGGSLVTLSSNLAVAANGTFPLWYQGDFKIKPVHTKYKPGFRIGGFYSSLCSTWEFGIVYTQLHSHYCNHSRADCDDALVLPTQLPVIADGAELLFRNSLGDDSPRAHSKLHFKYNMLDVIVTTSYCNDGCLTWQPYLGARFLEIKEKWNVRYAFNAESTLIPFTAVSATSRWHSKLPTGGVTIGVGGAYNFCGCWNVIGRVGASCVGGSAKQRTCLNATFSTSSTSNSFEPARVKKRKCAILTGFEGALGIAYNVHCCNLGVQLGVGYEFQTWLNVPTPIEHGIVIPGIRHNPSTNLTVHGLFVRAGVSF